MAVLERKNLLLVALLLILGLCLSTWMYQRGAEKEELYLAQKLDAFQQEYQIVVNSYQRMADFVFQNEIATSAVLGVMAEAADADEERQTDLRQQLLSEMAPLYERLKTLHFRQLHFHLPDSSSFLRLHRPEKFGDSLVGVRDTVTAVNEQFMPVNGFEEGRIFNGYRYVFPLRYEDRHVGSVEVSVSMAAIGTTLSSLFGKGYHFMLDADVVAEKVFAEEESNYRASEVAGFVNDVRAEQLMSEAHAVDVPEARAHKIVDEIGKKSTAEFSAWQTFAKTASDHGDQFAALFMPIRNFADRPVAYLFCFESDPILGSFWRENVMAVMLFALIFILLTVFVTHLNLARKKFRRLANHDLLTGSYNRSYGSAFLDTEHARAQRYGRTYALAIMDIDHFKRVNDTYGHHVGDQVLKHFAQLIEKKVRRSDLFCRWGGEEFVLLLPETDRREAIGVLRKLNQLVAQNPFPDVGRITVSVGLAVVRQEDRAWEDVLARADARLYNAKSAGRNRVCAVTVDETRTVGPGLFPVKNTA